MDEHAKRARELLAQQKARPPRGHFPDFLKAFEKMVGVEEFEKYEAHRALRSGGAPNDDPHGATP